MARAANVDLLELVRTAEALAASQPSQGLEGAAFALREAVLGGDFQSIIDRFNLSRVTINRLREQGVPALEAVTVAMREVGATREQVEAFGRTFEGRQATITSFFDELRQRLGAGLFERVSDRFGRLVNAHRHLRRPPARGGLGHRGRPGRHRRPHRGRPSAAPCGPCWTPSPPGCGTRSRRPWPPPPRPSSGTTEAARQAAPAVESWACSWPPGGGRRGAAARGQRVDRAYDAQLEPLERQLRLLQQSADVQRVQNALATNRATVEGLRLEREIAALRRAAGGATDPNAPGLSLRQRLIALALQDRELQREALGLEEERRPRIQSLEQQIARLQEQQRPGPGSP